MEQDNIGWLAVCLVVLILPPVAVWIVRTYLNLTRELRFLNLEIGRAEGNEKKRWIKERRRLWLSLFPFARR